MAHDTLPPATITTTEAAALADCYRFLLRQAAARRAAAAQVTANKPATKEKQGSGSNES